MTESKEREAYRKKCKHYGVDDFSEFFPDDGAYPDERFVHAGGKYAGVGAAGGSVESGGAYYFGD